MRVEHVLWLAMGVLGLSVGWIVAWLSQHHGTPAADPLMVVPCLVALASLNVAYWAMSKLTKVWKEW